MSARGVQAGAGVLLMLIGLLLAACAPAPAADEPTATAPPTAPANGPTPLPTRGPHPPGYVFDYRAQSGDTLEAIAAHFNTTVREIRAENPDLPGAVTTLPPGFPLRVPAYYLPLLGTPFRILPDSEVVNGPSAVGFDLQAAVQGRPGFLSQLDSFAYKRQRKAWEVVEVVARNYSINPRLLLALLEHQSHALSDANPDAEARGYPLGHRDPRYRGLFWQLVWAAERINDGYYGWRTGTLRELRLADGLIVRPDPWQNAGTVAVQNVFAGLYGRQEFDQAVGPEGFERTYRQLWGDPFARQVTLMPASLQQPELSLPFMPNRVWDFTGGPHPSWGHSLPLGALDFAPPSAESGCVESEEWVTAPAEGIVVRSEEAIVVLDLDGDGDERTGWVLFFFHVGSEGVVSAGTRVARGDLIGHPSCEGGRATGTHVHLARKYNGEWIPAGGPLAFELGGWVAAYGEAPYEGTLTKGSKVVPACPCSRAENQILYTFP